MNVSNKLGQGHPATEGSVFNGLVRHFSPQSVAPCLLGPISFRRFYSCLLRVRIYYPLNPPKLSMPQAQYSLHPCLFQPKCAKYTLGWIMPSKWTLLWARRPKRPLHLLRKASLLFLSLLPLAFWFFIFAEKPAPLNSDNLSIFENAKPNAPAKIAKPISVGWAI